MKKLISLFLCIILALSFVSCGKKDKGSDKQKKELAVTDDKYLIFEEFEDCSYYSDNCDEKCVLQADGYSIRVKDVHTIPEDIVIPSEHNGKPVVFIADEGFKECRLLKTVIIPDSVLGIGYKAFADCYYLKSAHIPSSVGYVCAYAFHDADGVITIDLPEQPKEWSDIWCEDFDGRVTWKD